MQEFTFLLRDQLTQGLRRSARRDMGLGNLTNAFNFVITESGLETHEPIISPFDEADVVVNFPFPQYMRNWDERYLFGLSDIWSVNNAFTPWQVDPITVFNAGNPLQQGAITPGGRWHIAGSPAAWIAVNGSSTVFKPGFDDMLAQTDKVYVSSTPMASAVYHKGHYVAGGLQEGTNWSSDELGPLADLYSGSHDVRMDEIGANWIMWSSVGEVDLPFWLFWPDTLPPAYGPTEENLAQRAKRNEWGWMPLPFSGKVLGLLPAGEMLVAYAQDGAAVLRFIPEAGTYGLIDTLPVGVASRGHLVGAGGTHLFVDSGGELWHFDQENGFQRLGYEEIFYESLAEPAAFSFDHRHKRVYLAWPDRCMVWQQGALTEVGQLPTSVSFEQGGNLGVFEDLPGTNAVLETGGFDLETRSLKTVTSVLVGFRGQGTVEVGLDYRMDGDDLWTEGPWVLCSPEGHARVQVTAQEFRLRLRMSNYQVIEVDYAEVKFQTGDRRYVRGPALGDVNPQEN